MIFTKICHRRPFSKEKYLRSRPDSDHAFASHHATPAAIIPFTKEVLVE